MPELFASHDCAAPLTPGCAEFARRAKLFGHDLEELEAGAELVTYTTMPTIASIGALSAATPEQRQARQEVFFNPAIELRRIIGQGVHDRLESAALAGGEMDPQDQQRAAPHFPFPARALSVLRKQLRRGEVWELSVRGEHWRLDDRDDILNVVNIGELHIARGASVMVRGNLLIMVVQRLACEPGRSFRPYQLAILPTPFPVDARTGPFHGDPGGDGHRGRDGAAGIPPVTRPTLIGPELVSAGAVDGQDGGDGSDGKPGGRGRTGGAAKIAEITIRDLHGPLTVLTASGDGGDGGNGGRGGDGGNGGRGASHPQTIDGLGAPGRGGRGGNGGKGGPGGRGGHGGIGSNVFIAVPTEQQGSVRVLTQPGRGGRRGTGGCGGAGGAGATGGDGGPSGAPGHPGAPGKGAKDGRERPAPPVFVNERPAQTTPHTQPIPPPRRVQSYDRRAPATSSTATTTTREGKP